MMELPENYKPKNFWERKEGTTGMLIGIPLLLALVYGLSRILPFIITLLQNAITAVLLFAVLAVIIYVITDRRTRNLFWYIYKSIMRALTRMFVEIDPIGILNSYVSDLKNNAENMYQQISNLRGQMRKLKNLIEQNEKERAQSLQFAGEAKKQNKQNIFVLKARKAGRLEESNLTLSALYTKMEMLYRVLNKMYETSLVLIEDMEDEVKVKTMERDAIKASYSAFKSAVRIIKGDPDKKEIFDQAMEYLTDDYGKKLGEIEHFMEISSSVIDSIDIQNGVYAEDALKKLDDWEKQSDSILLGDQKKMLIAVANDPTNVLELDVTPPKPSEAMSGKTTDSSKDLKYEELFEEDKKEGEKNG